jgi:hypothetical protein
VIARQRVTNVGTPKLNQIGDVPVRLKLIRKRWKGKNRSTAVRPLVVIPMGGRINSLARLEVVDRENVSKEKDGMSGIVSRKPI